MMRVEGLQWQAVQQQSRPLTCIGMVVVIKCLACGLVAHAYVLAATMLILLICHQVHARLHWLLRVTDHRLLL